ncbi:unnamed protein product [Caenorhabditis auriculariae]|uniref:Bicarbonate transporter-like transmembrane domain-containing protein n=1 Tax=Caenorhabditis auriculariae TaxID=2777116 RepID=A0A8S1GWQ7_9PELO|nr:unnamed protein product [Caenorhabditis auriculariae]
MVVIGQKDDTELIVRMEKVQRGRDFRTEVRGILDVKHLIEDAVVRMHAPQTHMHTILLSLFAELALHNPSEKFDLTLFKANIFSSNEKDNEAPRLHQKLQEYSGKDFFGVNQSWITTFCTLDGLKKRHVAIATLEEPTNLGLEMEETRIVVLILAPSVDKSTKSASETARTFGSLLSRNDLRNEILHSADDYQVRDVLLECAKKLSQAEASVETAESEAIKKCHYYPGKGIINDFKRRWPHYKSDYIDGIKDAKAVSKVVSTTCFLIFTIFPTTIAYGMLNDKNTNGIINVQKTLILTTSAPLSIYISVIYAVSRSNSWVFHDLYAAVGIYGQFFLILFAVLQIANVMKYTTRSTEEIFSLFIAFTLTTKALKAVFQTYSASYASCEYTNETVTSKIIDGCAPSAALLFIFLVCGTVWLSMTINSFRSSPYLSRSKRDIFADYALPIAVLIMALISYIFFGNVDKENFNIYPRYGDAFWIPFYHLPFEAHLVAVGLAFPLATLFFMDQLLVTNTVDNKQNKLKKGSAHHWDLFVVGILNIFLSLFGLPWMHGALPSSYLHLKALADVEDRLHNGYIQTIIVRVRETRLAVLAAHLLMIPIYFWGIPYITVFIPTAIFNGLFLFMAFSSMTGNEFWERILLIFTEQRAYPPTHYIRRVPQRIVHTFTAIEIFELCVLIVVGFAPFHYVEMAFPLVIASFIPFRMKEDIEGPEMTGNGIGYMNYGVDSIISRLPIC